MEAGQKRWIPSETIFRSQRFAWNDIATTSDAALATYTDTAPLVFPNQTLLKSPASPAVYRFFDGVRQVFFSAKSFLAHGYSWGNIFTAPQEELISYPIADSVGYPDGALLKADTAHVYLVINQQLRHIPTEVLFIQLGFDWHNIIVVGPTEFGSLTIGPALTSINEVPAELLDSLDVDLDHLNQTVEYLYGTNPDIADTDGDGYLDGTEVKFRYNPTDPRPMSFL